MKTLELLSVGASGFMAGRAIGALLFEREPWRNAIKFTVGAALFAIIAVKLS